MFVVFGNKSDSSYGGFLSNMASEAQTTRAVVIMKNIRSKTIAS